MLPTVTILLSNIFDYTMPVDNMIQEYENSLRYIISHILGEGDSTDFKVDLSRVKKWKERRETENKRGGLTENRILFFSDLSDLGIIVINNWDKFEVIFQDQERFNTYFNEIKTLRNSLSHGRDLLPFQECFLAFALGDLKTQITKYHNKNMNVDDYFIRILKVNDNVGNIWDKPHPLTAAYHTDSKLKVGDKLEFLVNAFDPKGKVIEYQLTGEGLNQKNNDGKFSFEITKEMISRATVFHIMASTDKIEYRNEVRFSVVYSVLP